MCDLHGLNYIMFIHSSGDRHLGYLDLLAIVNKAAMNIHIQGFVWSIFYLG